MLLATHKQGTFADLQLPGKFLDGRRGRGGRVHPSRSDDAEEERGDEDLTIADDGDDVFVGSVGADAVSMTKTVGDALGQVSLLGFGRRVGGVRSFLVQDRVVLRDAVLRVRGFVSADVSTTAAKLTEEQCQQIDLRPVDGGLSWVAMDSRHSVRPESRTCRPQ